MLKNVVDIHGDTVERLFALYAESMHILQKQFPSLEEMKQSYTDFLIDFLSSPNQLILVEEIGGKWVSGLRAIETAEGKWFLEAVETKPDKRNLGYGKILLLDTIAYLKNMGMHQVSCQIAKSNIKSQKLHTSCGFTPTTDPSTDPWGATDEQTILYKYYRI